MAALRPNDAGAGADILAAVVSELGAKQLANRDGGAGLGGRSREVFCV